MRHAAVICTNTQNTRPSETLQVLSEPKGVKET